MNKPIHGEEINKILLKPRFKLEVEQSKDEILNKFKANLADKDCKYCSKISGNHIFLDVPKNEEHFWSPQLAVEVLEGENGKTIVKGILGPKPQVWTFFMFLHFITAVAFVIFSVLYYVNASLGKEVGLYRILFFGLPLLWVILYFAGQSGKKLGYKQMVALDDFLMKTIRKNTKNNKQTNI